MRVNRLGSGSGVSVKMSSNCDFTRDPEPTPGLLLLIALTGYTVKNAWKNDLFFSWSYFSGGLALPFSIIAGLCFLLADMIVQSTDAISGFPRVPAECNPSFHTVEAGQ
ncbi:claudin domain-containing protein 2-like [Lemur catta]|uniref:claudin domain-containing protein 2-like n=1 Tax=Lemur catta TaxID=9447 RepID=UPI001E26A953|nr:claudin domain-containing protein 2-like [Lemur catta]